MSATYRNVSGALTLGVGVLIGWGIASIPGPKAVLRAHGGDRAGESILTTGPVLVRYDEGRKVQTAQDAVYYLDYTGARLYASVPSFRQSFGPAKLLDNFAERDLAADFKLDLDNGPRPRFMMTTGSLGAYSEGWAALYVFETTTNQVAAYKVQQQMVGTSTQNKFELIEVRPISSKNHSQTAR